MSLQIPSSFWVVCPDSIPTDLSQRIEQLKSSTYKKGFEDRAPHETDCLTAVAYIFREIQRWRLDWIGNMPRKLVADYNCKTALRTKKLMRGDIIFFANRVGEIWHVGVSIGRNKIFHNSKVVGKGHVENLTDILSRRDKRGNDFIYYTVSNEDALLSQIDRRTELGLKNAQMFRRNGQLSEQCVFSKIKDHPRIPTSFKMSKSTPAETDANEAGYNSDYEPDELNLTGPGISRPFQFSLLFHGSTAPAETTTSPFPTITLPSLLPSSPPPALSPTFMENVTKVFSKTYPIASPVASIIASPQQSPLSSPVNYRHEPEQSPRTKVTLNRRGSIVSLKPIDEDASFWTN